MIPVRNVYYMLAYAFSSLRSKGFKELSREEFDSAADLMAAIITQGINMQIKRGLVHEYHTQDTITSSPKGKIDVSASLKQATLSQMKLACRYDEFTVNAYLNRILKTTGLLLLRAPLETQHKRNLRIAVGHLQQVSPLELRDIEWRQSYNRLTQTYKMLINVCRMTVQGFLHCSQSGKWQVEDFIDDSQMSTLFERFVFAYFKQKHGDITTVESPFIPWMLDGSHNEMLPAMRTDIALRRRENESNKSLSNCDTLIIDTKYYTENLRVRFDRQTVISANLYQIFAYVKNEQENLRRLGKDDLVAGMLLYARTDQEIQPDVVYQMSGNEIAVTTLDLNCEFELIAKQLDGIVERYFGNIR